MTYVAELEPGISDDTVLDVANRESAVLVTAYKDFGNFSVLSPGTLSVYAAGASKEKPCTVFSL